MRSIQNQLDDNYDRLNKLRLRKNEILTKLGELQTITQTAKSSRDEKNRLIAEKKAIRDQLHKEKAEITEKIKELVAKKRTIIANAKEPEDILVSQLKEITWRYQTTTLSMDEDRKAVQEIAELEKKLLYFKKTKDLDQEVRKLRSRFNELKSKANAAHNEVLTLADESKKHHESLIQAHEQGAAMARELDGIRAEMSELWEDIQRSKSQLSETRAHFDEAKTIAMQQKAEKLAEQAKLLMTRRTELAERATEKLKKGERLTFEEYGALLEEKSSVS
jgi:uncharacterized coiled-coil DUF342 family protein